jgi:hypothetical protein
VDGQGLFDRDVADGGGKEHTHHLRPTSDVNAILGAWLAIYVMDDRLGNEPEQLDITLGGDLFVTGMPTFAFDYSEIKAELFETDGRYDVDSSPSDSPCMQ